MMHDQATGPTGSDRPAFAGGGPGPSGSLEAPMLPGEPGASAHGYSAHKSAYLKRLRRIEGQIRGIHRMVEEDTYCIDILTQVAAATKALQAVALGLLDEHLGHCVVRAAQAGGEEAEVKLAEANAAIARLVRS